MAERATLSVARESFDSLGSDWELLLLHSTADPLFCSPLWQRAWWETFGDSDDLLLIAVREGQRLLGVAPLRRHGGEISFLAGQDVTDYLDFVVASGEERPFFQALLDLLAKEPWQQLDFHCLLPHSTALNHLLEVARTQNLAVHVEQEEVSPAIDLPFDWEGYLATLGKKDRHELRRKMRRLQTTSFRYYSVDDPAHLSSDLEDFFRLHRLSRPEKAYFMTPHMEGFFRAISSALLARGQLRLYFLEVDGRRVSTAMCFDRGDEILLYNSGFDPEYSHLSVGLLLKALCIMDAIESGKRRFDFLRGPEPYKYDLGGKDVPLNNLVIVRP